MNWLLIWLLFLHAGAIASTEQDTAQTAIAAAPNSDPVYQQLRNITPGGKTIVVKDFVLKRDAGTFTFKSGSFAFLTPVQGKTTGAVFIGSATFTLDPPIATEKWSLARLTKTSPMIETFSIAVFRFTDGTEREIEAKGAPSAGFVAGPAGEALAGIQSTLRNDIRYNLDARILQDVLSPEPGGFFCAFIRGEKFSGKEIYVLDPHGVPGHFLQIDVVPEEVAFATYTLSGEGNAGVWAAFHYSDEYANGTASNRQINSAFCIPRQSLNATIDWSGPVSGVATTTVTALVNGVRVVPLNLFYFLRVSGVTADDQRPLSFIQEENKDTAEDHYSQFSVILPAPLAAGESFTFSTTYGGLYTVGDSSYANFYLRAPTNWYPNSYSAANYATYDMTFHIPKELVMVATASKTAERTDGKFDVTEWHTDVPIPQADFNLGEFRKVETSLAEQGVILENFARVHAPTQSITSNQMKRILGEAQLAITLYTDFFGPVPYKRIALSQQSSNARGYSERYQPGYWSTSERFPGDQPPFFGQSYAGLILTPLASYDGGIPLHLQSYLHALDPYGIAKQWWGNATGQNSYRDRWMFEGLAEFSASLFLQAFYKDGSYDKFWDEELYLLTEKDAKRHRRVDEGPVMLGSRLGVFQGGLRVPTRQVSTKGAYILNMIRMMMWSNETQDADFKKLMHDFVQTYTNRPATTEDFKVAVEQHITPAMNLTGDGKMDWFFNEYLDGTALPRERFTYSFSKAPDGTPILKFKIEQSGVDSTFRMAIPVYVKQADGGVIRVARVPLTGNTTFEDQVVLHDLKTKPKSAVINYYHDVLCTQN